ncbi:Adaptive-response sensory-kinase SasA [subsurface metagenome]
MQRSDEIGTLAQEFNRMVERLTQARKKLLEQSYSLGKAEMASRVLDETRKRAAELEEAYRKLGNANQELQNFAHIVSHDLKAPLRGIKLIANWILTDYADKFDEDGRKQMNSLSSRVEWMYKLIEGVLKYSRVGRVKEERVEVDLNKVVPEIIDVIAPPENIAITVENKLPVIECEQTRITQMFENLLSNAVKYIDKPQGQIKIGCVEEDDFWKFSVADNGPGIEEKHFERIFQIFQTMAPHNEFESTGVGLTVTKKIVELYDGKIWVESKVGEGSTFFFTLPKQEKGAKDAKLEANITC